MNPSDRQLGCESHLPAVRSAGCASRRRGLRVSSVRLSRSLGAIVLAGLIAACGGSGGGDTATVAVPPPASASSDFDLRNAYTTYLSNGFTQIFNVTGAGGNCTGTETQVSDKPFKATFNGKEAFAILLSDKLELQNCPNLLQGPAAVFQYFNADFQALGAAAVPAGSYGVYEKPVIYPTNVQAGDKGVLGTLLLYADSTRSIFIGQQVLSYEARADTPASADSLLILFTQTSYDTSNVPVPTGAFQTATYRLAKDRSFKIVSIDVRDANGQQVRLMPVAQ